MQTPQMQVFFSVQLPLTFGLCKVGKIKIQLNVSEQQLAYFFCYLLCNFQLFFFPCRQSIGLSSTEWAQTSCSPADSVLFMMPIPPDIQLPLQKGLGWAHVLSHSLHPCTGALLKHLVCLQVSGQTDLNTNSKGQFQCVEQEEIYQVMLNREEVEYFLTCLYS